MIFLVDGVIVSGIATGQPADVSEARAVAGAVGVPTLVGSSVTADNLRDYIEADANNS
ncbi:MAG TPA: BtpA/SgcQ family protein [Vicinamibacterales bacterium]|jgi:predicted TIM-barrel enzyme|nr:BtpA/SgcQ family protein [Vicinamibacterales bacterium]